MEIQKKKDNKCCGTCSYWGGDTKLKNDMVYIYNERGDCKHPNDRQGTPHYSRTPCKNWKPKY